MIVSATAEPHRCASLSAQVEALHEREYRPPFNPRACTEQRAAVLECYQRMSGQPAGEVCSALRRRPSALPPPPRDEPASLVRPPPASDCVCVRGGRQQVCRVRAPACRLTLPRSERRFPADAQVR